MHGALFAATALAALAAPTFGAGRPTYSVDYVVRLSRREPGLAHVHWLLAGIDEIAAFPLVFPDDRTTDVRGTRRLVWHGRTPVWAPGGPYPHRPRTVPLHPQQA